MPTSLPSASDSRHADTHWASSQLHFEKPFQSNYQRKMPDTQQSPYSYTRSTPAYSLLPLHAHAECSHSDSIRSLCGTAGIDRFVPDSHSLLYPTIGSSHANDSAHNPSSVHSVSNNFHLQRASAYVLHNQKSTPDAAVSVLLLFPFHQAAGYSNHSVHSCPFLDTKSGYHHDCYNNMIS